MAKERQIKNIRRFIIRGLLYANGHLIDRAYLNKEVGAAGTKKCRMKILRGSARAIASRVGQEFPAFPRRIIRSVAYDDTA